MGKEKDSPSVESDGTNDDETLLSRSRRRVLRNVAAVGILGMTGTATITEAANRDSTESVRTIESREPVRITESTDPIRITESEMKTNDMEAQAARIVVEGVADYSNYTVVADGTLTAGSYAEAGDDVNTVDPNTAYGEVQDKNPGNGVDEWGFIDDYYYTVGVTVTVTSGVIDVYY